MNELYIDLGGIRELSLLCFFFRNVCFDGLFIVVVYIDLSYVYIFCSLSGFLLDFYL